MKKNSIHTTAGFKVPDGYLDQLTERVLQNTQNQEVEDHSGFKIPEGYLKVLEDRIMSQIDTETKIIPLQTSRAMKWFYPLLAVAALFIGVIAINGLFTDNKTDQVTFADLEDQEISDYLVDANFLQDDESVELLFSDNSILSEIKIEQNITENELFEYLMEDATWNQIITE
jgi:hypothetical protein